MNLHLSPNVRRPIRAAGLAAIVLVVLHGGGGRANAQWGMGWGWGGGGWYNSTMSERDLMQHSLISAQAAYAQRSSISHGYQGVTNPYYNNVRDTAFFEKYDPATRRTMEDFAARNPRRRPAANTPAPAAPAVQPIALAKFFDRYNQVAWPGDAPTTGDLGARRTVSDQATSQVLREVNAGGSATLASVTDARSKLIAYGKPALKYVREHSAPVIADAFHSFMLSLYDSLAAAATPRAQP